MAESFDNDWEITKSELYRLGLGMRGRLPEELNAIEAAEVPVEFFTVRNDASVLAFGWGTGAYVVRLASWSSKRRIVCIEPNPTLRRKAAKLVNRLGFDGVRLCATVEEALPKGNAVDLLLLDESYANSETLRLLLERHEVDTVLGAYHASACNNVELFRICLVSAATFHLVNRTTGQHLAGCRQRGPQISVIVVGSDDALEATIGSVLAQEGVDVELIVAIGADSPFKVSAQGWVARHPSAIRVVVAPSEDESVCAALASACGLYVTFVQSGDTCDPAMLVRYLDAAVTSRADVVIGAYRERAFADGSVEPRYGFGSTRIDLRHTDASRLAGVLHCFDPAPVIGRCLIRLQHIAAAEIGWSVKLGRAAAGLFLARCLLAAHTVAVLPDVYYLHRQSLAESAGATYRFGDLETVHRICAALTAAAFVRGGSYARERELRECLLKLYAQLYFEYEGLGQRLRVMRALVSSCLGRMQYGSRTEFVINKAISFFWK